MTRARKSRTFLAGALAAAAFATQALAQTAGVAPEPLDGTRERTVLREKAGAPAPSFDAIYEEFYTSYRLGPEDEITIAVRDQPDYSIEKVEVSPLGRIFHPLIGDLPAAGLTVEQLERRLAEEFAEYVRNPYVTVVLRRASSVKIGVLGEVQRPGIVVMSRPMTVLDAIASAGGFTNFGKRSSVTLLRQRSDGALETVEVNLKRVMEGKARREENLQLRAGDTVIVHGNAKKALAFVSSLTGFGNFLEFLRR